MFLNNLFLKIVFIFLITPSLFAKSNAKETNQCMAFVLKIAHLKSDIQYTEAEIFKILKNEKELKSFTRKQYFKIHPDKCNKRDKLCGHEVLILFNECIQLLQKGPKKSWKDVDLSKIFPKDEETVYICAHMGPDMCARYQESCIWDATAQFCLHKSFSSCSSAREVDACVELGCAWNSSSMACLSPAFSTCKDASSSATCSQMYLCVWDISSKLCRPWL